MLSELLISIDACLRNQSHKHHIRVRDVPYFIALSELSPTFKSIELSKIMRQHVNSASRWLDSHAKRGLIIKVGRARYKLTPVSRSIAEAAIADLRANDIVAGSLRFKF